MASNFRALVAKRTINLVKSTLKSNDNNVTQHEIVQHMKLQKSPRGSFNINLPLSALFPSQKKQCTNISKFIEKFETDEYISAVLTSTGIEEDTKPSPELQFCLKQNMVTVKRFVPYRV